MKLSDRKKLVGLYGKCGYNADNKKLFRSLSRKLLKDLVDALGLAPGSYDLRYNAAGVAMSGDATLHHDSVYVTFNMDGMDWILVRTCTSRRDYTGGVNRSFRFERLLDESGFEDLVKFVRGVMTPMTFVVHAAVDVALDSEGVLVDGAHRIATLREMGR